MRVVLQRVRLASVTVDGRPRQSDGEGRGREVARIGPGLVALVGFPTQHNPAVNPRMAQRIVNLRCFDDEQGRLNRSLEDVQGELLLIPQITLSASLAKGPRPSFHTAAAPEVAKGLFEAFLEAVRAVYPRVAVGVFQAAMVVSLENDGPVTFALDEV